MPTADALDSALDVLRQYWGYDELRPFQREAVAAGLNGRDSLVVLPTGGGKSLCYQLPAVCQEGLAIVVSPLIALMKDQVDSLRECGIPAAAVHSALPPAERREIADDIRANRLKLLYVAPERLCTERMLDFLAECPVSFIAIDEAHCISNWGHDFRPEYRLLGQLRDRFPGVALHAYTATATEAVRRDIASQLNLHDPDVIVGLFDRPNLNYRVAPRGDLWQQVTDVVERYRGESGVIYSISRREVDELAERLKRAGYRAVPYHAGLSDVDRHRHQDAFLNDKADIVVATVAFGMGIDKTNVRYVIHTAAPKSVESYQQESGRAGRDGLPSDCCLFFGTRDFVTWRKMQDQLTGQAAEQALVNLREIERFCTGATCRHRTLVEYFGQTYEGENCGACDICTDPTALLDDALIVGQKILSCVIRVKEGFGADYVAQVLTGSKDQRILANGHDQLSTYNLLGNCRKAEVRQWIDQLAGQGFLEPTGEFRVLCVTPAGRQLLKGEAAPRLSKRSQAAPAKASGSRRAAVADFDVALFERLRTLRRELAEARGVPPFVVFGDVTLQDLARRKPTTLEEFLETYGVGEKKCNEYGEIFLKAIADGEDSAPPALSVRGPESPGDVKPPSSSQLAADELFRAGHSIAEAAATLGRAESTTRQYLVDFLERDGRCNPAPWVSPEVFTQVDSTARELGDFRLKPIFDQLGGAVSYDQLHVAVACLRNALKSATSGELMAE